jgi:hypothetical protein
MPPVPQKKKSNAKILITIAVIIVLIVAGAGTAIYFATRPQPVISVTSTYHTGATSAGASGTTLKLTGSKFSGNSAITFLLDGTPTPGNSPVQSNSDGAVTATLNITDAWSTGNHTITARDASGYLTKVGVPIAIVTPGQAHTPGPNGAPSDDASGTIVAMIQASGQSGTLNLSVKGSANGGTVCGDEDDGQPHVHTGTTQGLSYIETRVFSCSGTYKGGRLSYTETATSDKLVFDNGATCTASTPFVNAHLEGTFTSATAINGSFSQDAITVTCNFQGASQSNSTAAATGTWTANASMQ